MKFSLETNHTDSLDVISLFPLKHAVTFPQELWFQVLSASLRSKHEVLILERPLTQFPSWDKKKRWDTGDNWCWLAPRSLRIITEAYLKSSSSYEEFKTLLKNSK